MGKISVLGDVHDPRRFGALPNPTRQSDAGLKLGRLGDPTKGFELIGIVQVPKSRRNELGCAVFGEPIGMANGPTGIGADFVETGLYRLVDDGGLVCRNRDFLQQLGRPGAFAQCLFDPFALGNLLLQRRIGPQQGSRALGNFALQLLLLSFQRLIYFPLFVQGLG